MKQKRIAAVAGILILALVCGWAVHTWNVKQEQRRQADIGETETPEIGALRASLTKEGLLTISWTEDDLRSVLGGVTPKEGFRFLGNTKYKKMTGNCLFFSNANEAAAFEADMANGAETDGRIRVQPNGQERKDFIVRNGNAVCCLTAPEEEAKDVRNLLKRAGLRTE